MRNLGANVLLAGMWAWCAWPAVADPVIFADPVHKVAATYDDKRWHAHQVPDKDVVLAIAWKNTHGNNVAFCALRVMEVPFAKQVTGPLEDYREDITLALMTELKAGDPKAELLSSEMVTVNGSEFIRVKRKGSFNGAAPLVLDGLIAFRSAEEIAFDCLYSAIRLNEIGPKLLTEAEITSVLGSLKILD